MNEFEKFENIPKEKFAFANNNGHITDKKLETKPIGYFKDALIRFRKNRASVVAFFIIVLIALYALIIPVCTTGSKKTLLDSYYAKMGPRNEWLKENVGVLDGGVTNDYNEKALIYEYAKGVAAEYDGENVISLGSSWDSFYQPINKIKKIESVRQGANYNNIYTLEVDTYLQVGFIYRYLTNEQLEAVKNWEAETGLQVLFPMIASNEYNIDANNANYWYKSVGGTPVSVSEDGTVTKLKYSEDLVLEDNYMRDSNGELVYELYTGSGDGNDQYKVRVLYYNYYKHLNGYSPNYLLGTDSQGYDLAYRLAKGIQLSLMLAILVSIINFVIGAIYGAVEGYYGGNIDLAMERVTDILSGIPFIVVATLFQLHLAKKLGPIPSLIFAFVMTGWISTSKRVRTQFYRFKNQEYVMAARTLGARDRRIIWKHIFPNTLGTIITSSVLVIPGVIFSESMLSFLGIVNLGGSTSISLGTLLSSASKIWTLYPHLMIYPAIIISLLMISFNLFGNGLRDAFNPSLRGVEE